jgi:hypothetical protein
MFLKGTQNDFHALTTKNPNAFYFLEDSRELYIGNSLYTEPVRVYTGALPVTPARGVLYINETTGVGSMHNGSGWRTVFRAVVTTITATATDDTLPTSKAVKDYVNERIKDITSGDGIVTDVSPAVDHTGDAIPGTLTVTKGNGSEIEVELEGMAHGVTWDSANMVLTVPMVGSAVPLTINIPKDEFVEDGYFDPDTAGTPPEPAIVLILKSGSEIRIPAHSLINLYTSGSGVNDTVTIVIDPATEKISAMFKVDTTGALGLKADGTLTFDITEDMGFVGLMDKVDELEALTAWGTF